MSKLMDILWSHTGLGHKLEWLCTTIRLGTTLKMELALGDHDPWTEKPSWAALKFSTEDGVPLSGPLSAQQFSEAVWACHFMRQYCDNPPKDSDQTPLESQERGTMLQLP